MGLVRTRTMRSARAHRPRTPAGRPSRTVPPTTRCAPRTARRSGCNGPPTGQTIPRDISPKSTSERPGISNPIPNLANGPRGNPAPMEAPQRDDRFGPRLRRSLLCAGQSKAPRMVSSPAQAPPWLDRRVDALGSSPLPTPPLVGLWHPNLQRASRSTDSPMESRTLDQRQRSDPSRAQARSCIRQTTIASQVDAARWTMDLRGNGS